MGDSAERIYRNGPAATLRKPDGSVVTGRGLVARLKTQASDYAPGQRHETGWMDSPLWVFTGSLPGAEPGDQLEQGGGCYRVLKAEKLPLGGRVVCLRAVLERSGEEDAGDDGT